MNNTLKLILKGFLVVTAILSIAIVVMIKIDVICLPPKHYQPKKQLNLSPPVMTLEEYTASGLIDSHSSHAPSKNASEVVRAGLRLLEKEENTITLAELKRRLNKEGSSQ